MKKIELEQWEPFPGEYVQVVFPLKPTKKQRFNCCTFHKTRKHVWFLRKRKSYCESSISIKNPTFAIASVFQFN